MSKLTPLLLLVGALACDRKPPAKSAGGQTARAVSAGRDITAWTVRADGYGRLALGVALAEVNAVLGEPLPTEQKAFQTCPNLRTSEMPRGVSLMVERDSVGAAMRVERINVDSTGVRTAEGASVGDTEDRVKQLYGSLLHVEPHKYTGPTGHYLIVQPAGDSVHRIMFETDGQHVLRFRAGRRPAVDYVEGCG